MKTLNTQALLSEAIRLLESTDAPDQLLEGLVDLQRSLPPRMQAAPPPLPPHLATNPNAGEHERMVEDWIARNGSPRLSPELRVLADAIGDVEL